MSRPKKIVIKRMEDQGQQTSASDSNVESPPRFSNDNERTLGTASREVGQLNNKYDRVACISP